MACFLHGTPLTHAKGHDIVSDGVAKGAIQVPGNGLPIILMADRQSTGGYPKIAPVIGPDLGRLAQLQGGSQIVFGAVSVADAVAGRRAEAEALRGDVAREPVVRTDFAAEFPLGLNLVGVVVDGFAESLVLPRLIDQPPGPVRTKRLDVIPRPPREASTSRGAAHFPVQYPCALPVFRRGSLAP